MPKNGAQTLFGGVYAPYPWTWHGDKYLPESLELREKDVSLHVKP